MAEYIQITDNIIKLVKYTTIDSYEDGLSKLNIIHHFIIEQINQQNHINKYMINKTDILSEINKEHYFYIGSQFEKDLQSDEYILKHVDIYYDDSEIIMGLKKGNNGFYAYSKIISDEEIDKLYSIVDKNIKNASENIINGVFDINPKQIKDKLKGCNYCRYKDICYMRNEDIVELPEVKDIFGGDL